MSLRWLILMGGLRGMGGAPLSLRKWLLGQGALQEEEWKWCLIFPVQEVDCNPRAFGQTTWAAGWPQGEGFGLSLPREFEGPRTQGQQGRRGPRREESGQRNAFPRTPSWPGEGPTLGPQGTTYHVKLSCWLEGVWASRPGRQAPPP